MDGIYTSALENYRQCQSQVDKVKYRNVTMSRISFAFLVVIGMILSTTAAQKQCPPNQEYTTCGSACPPSCNNSNPKFCTMQCVVGCQCKQGFLLNAEGNCVSPYEC